MRLANITWPRAQKYFEENDMVIVSIGSIECHGRHMPLGTDTLIPDRLLELIEEKSDVLIAPTIPYGACDIREPLTWEPSCYITCCTRLLRIFTTMAHAKSWY